jgi:hypothetical protein
MDDDREGLSDIDRALAAALDVDVSPNSWLACAPGRERAQAGALARLADRPPLAVATVAIAAVGAANLWTRGQSGAPFLVARPLELGLRPADVRPVRPVLAVDSPRR